VNVFDGTRSLGRLSTVKDRLAVRSGRVALRLVNEAVFLDRSLEARALEVGETVTLTAPSLVSAFISVKGDQYVGLRILLNGRVVDGPYPAQIARLAGGTHHIVFRWTAGRLEGTEVSGDIELGDGRNFVIRAEPDVERVVVQRLR
jgi:hypothetical protein